jgi:membrane protease YdiL (CAAX protease family)
MLLLFLILTYAVMWTMFIVVAVAVPARTLPGSLMVLAGAYAPGLVAIALTWRERGRAGVRELLGRILIADVPVRLYVIAVTYMAAIKLATAVLHRAIAGAWPRFETGSLYLIPLAIAFSTPFQAGEEIGWRGFALPRLAERFGLRGASLLLGVIWALWHVPQFFIADADTYHQSFPVWAGQVVAISVAMAWLYARSGGSLLLPMLMHAAINNSKDIVPAGRAEPPGVFSLQAPAVSWIALALMWIAAGYFLARMPSTTIDGARRR